MTLREGEEAQLNLVADCMWRVKDTGGCPVMDSSAEVGLAGRSCHSESAVRRWVPESGLL